MLLPSTTVSGYEDVPAKSGKLAIAAMITTRMSAATLFFVILNFPIFRLLNFIARAPFVFVMVFYCFKVITI